MGFWAVSGSGEVYAYGDCVNYGGLRKRVYNLGMGGGFRLNPVEWATSITPTETGNGYWITFGSGRVAAFGDAITQGGPTDMYEDLRDPYETNVAVDETNFDWSFFRALVWDVAADPDGTGFWILTASGDVLHYEAEFWGKPAYEGLTGMRWHEGNFDGDWSKIVKDILMWGGFLFHNSDTEYDSMIVIGDSISALGFSNGSFNTTNRWHDRLKSRGVFRSV